MTSSAKPVDDHDPTLTDHGLASVTLTAKWSDDRAQHENQLHVAQMSVWREADTLPATIGRNLAGLRPADRLECVIDDGELLPAWAAGRELSARIKDFDGAYRPGMQVTPHIGRFYPQGFFHNVRGIVREAVEPARIIEMDGDWMKLDLNHPLSDRTLKLSLQVDQVLQGYDRRGGRCLSPVDDLLRYPGLGASLRNGARIEYGDDRLGMSRMDERPDSTFYDEARMVQHLDARALQTIRELHRKIIPDHAHVLDLMGSFDSHLQSIELRRLDVLGMNQHELASNPQADDHILQNLNLQPELNIPTATLDAVVCTASIEYLNDPVTVMGEVLRTLRPGGTFIVTFSNRWFPTKAIKIWSELHEFERLGMVTQWLQRAGFRDLHTFSSSGWPRPGNDRHSQQTNLSDPVYAVWGMRPAD